ncbi:MAG: PrsW family glutamic-type intramembrane protease [Treponemataceae bacterium]
MNIFFIILISFLPCVLSSIVKSKIAPNVSFMHVCIALFLGFFALIPLVGTLSFITLFFTPTFLQSFFGVVFQSFFLNAVIEESFKLLFLITLFKQDYAKKDFLYLVAIFGFALGGFETIAYALKTPSILFLRVVTAVILHGITCGLSGCFYYYHKNKLKKNASTFFLFAIFIHGLYNFFSSFGSFFLFFAFITLLLGLCIFIHEFNAPDI